MPCAERPLARGTAGGVRGARPLPALERQPLRAGAGAVFPLRHPPLSHPAATIARQRRRAIPFAGYTNLLKRRFEEAIDIFLAAQARDGPERADFERAGGGLSRLGFQTLADQVRRSVRSVRGNQWMFRIGHPADYPLRIRPELLRARRRRASSRSCANPRRSAWTYAQRLERHLLPGHGFPEGARVAQHLDGPGVRRPWAGAPKPPVEAYFRVIDQPVLRLVERRSASAAPKSRSIAEVFDFARDYLGLLKAAVIASGHRAAGHGRRHAAAGRSAGAAHRRARAAGSKSSAR